MKKNVGSTDRAIRIAGGLVVLALTASGTITGVAGVVLALAGAVFVITGLVHYCPLYGIAGISTCGAGCGKSGGCGKGACHRGDDNSDADMPGKDAV